MWVATSLSKKMMDRAGETASAGPFFGGKPMGQQVCPIFRANLPVWRAEDKQVWRRAAGIL
jgi:hypothetical protein